MGLSICRIGALAAVSLLSGCTYGFLYSDTTVPLVANMRGQPYVSEQMHGNSNVIQEPITGTGIRIEWSSHAIGDIAKIRGLERVHYADIRTVAILGSIYKRRVVSVYGQKPAEE